MNVIHGNIKEKWKKKKSSFSHCHVTCHREYCHWKILTEKMEIFKHGKGDRQGQTCLTRAAEKVLALLEKLCLVIFCHNFIADLSFNLCLTKGNGPYLSSPSCRNRTELL